MSHEPKVRVHRVIYRKHNTDPRNTGIKPETHNWQLREGWL